MRKSHIQGRLQLAPEPKMLTSLAKMDVTLNSEIYEPKFDKNKQDLPEPERKSGGIKHIL